MNSTHISFVCSDSKEISSHRAAVEMQRFLAKRQRASLSSHMKDRQMILSDETVQKMKTMIGAIKEECAALGLNKKKEKDSDATSSKSIPATPAPTTPSTVPTSSKDKDKDKDDKSSKKSSKRKREKEDKEKSERSSSTSKKVKSADELID